MPRASNPSLCFFIHCKSKALFLYCVFFAIALGVTPVAAQPVPVLTYTGGELPIGAGALLLKDSSRALSLAEVRQSQHFLAYDKPVINEGISKNNYWLTFTIKNASAESKLLLHITQPNLDIAELFIMNSDGSYTKQQSGTSLPFRKRYYHHQDIIFSLPIPPQQQEQIFLKVNNAAQLTLPMQVGSERGILLRLTNNDVFFSILCGAVICMFFYNLFIYYTVKDSIYISYAVCILAVSLAQGSLAGYTVRYIWPRNTWLAQNGFILFGNLSSLAVIVFTRRFLQTKFYLPKLTTGLYISMIPFIVSLLLLLANRRQESFVIMQLSVLICAVYPVLLAWLTYRKKFRPAKYFLFSWLSLCAGGAVFVCKDFGLLPVNMFTMYSIQIGFALEVILLAFALADKINIYKMEKERSQAERIDLLRKHETMIRENNIILETKIKFRTKELQTSNENLQAAVSQLKEAQTQLVTAEKMASLGFLTAGIAHEINNPINYVTNNLKPLLLDIYDLFELITQYQEFASLDECKYLPAVKSIKNYEEQINLEGLKDEITELVGGIKEGALRTAEIVKGLRNFSRLDEDLSAVNIHEGINSTLVLLRSTLPSYIRVHKDFGATRLLECYPGMLNQVFMNLLTNSIYAITAKENKNEESIVIVTKEKDDWLHISITDTGIGMTEETKKKMFEPFFTTKPVGDGTGMGMPIVFKIIEKHKGKFFCESAPDIGTIVTLHIPYCIACLQ